MDEGFLCFLERLGSSTLETFLDVRDCGVAPRLMGCIQASSQRYYHLSLICFSFCLISVDFHLQKLDYLHEQYKLIFRLGSALIESKILAIPDPTQATISALSS